TEPAPKDELLRGRHRGDRIELEEAEPPYGLEHPAGGAVEELGPDGDPPRLLQRDSSSPAGHGDIISYGPWALDSQVPTCESLVAKSLRALGFVGTRHFRGRFPQRRYALG